MLIDEIAKEMTREEFLNKLNFIEKGEYVDGGIILGIFIICPNDTGLIEHCSHKKKCQDCWQRAIKDIKFKDEIEGEEKQIFKTETVDHPQHYNTGRFEVIDVIEDWDMDFNLGNAIKYIARCEHKGKKKEDLEKAIWYLNRELKKEDK